MLCAEFEALVSDYIEASLDAATQRACAEHALSCPVCHEILGEVKHTLRQCQAVAVESPVAVPQTLEAGIFARTNADAEMSCGEFEEHLTDFLDGFLPAPLYHRWQRHAAVCAGCTELPGVVVRSIGACYTSLQDELPVSAQLHARILQTTIGTADAAQMRASRVSGWLVLVRRWLDTAFSPQLATVATMVLVAVIVGTTTISDDGSIGGMYRATLRIAAQTYVRGADTASRAAISNDLRRVAAGWSDLFGGVNLQEGQPPTSIRMSTNQPRSEAESKKASSENERRNEQRRSASQ